MKHVTGTDRQVAQVLRALDGEPDAVEYVHREARSIDWPLVRPRVLRQYPDAGTQLDRLIGPTITASSTEQPTRTLDAPMSMAALLNVPDPEERDIASGIIPADGNVLLAAYPKSHKTNVVLDLGVSAASATAFLGRFAVSRRHRVGIVLYEDAKHRVRRRITRMCKAHGIEPESLDGWLHIWFRPALRFADPKAMADLRAYAVDLELDLLEVDNWSYAATGDSNDADVVTPQLSALSEIRNARPGMTALLVQHARKASNDKSGDRLTDIIRNSSAFGAWYDCGIVLSRPNEHAPVTVRTEMRDRPAPAEFSFTVEDEYPGSDLHLPSGALRLIASDKTPAQVQRLAAAEQLKPAVAEFVKANPGTSKRKLRDAVKGDNAAIDLALELLVQGADVRVEEPAGKGKPSRIWPTVLDRAETVLPAHQGDRADRAAPPVGGRTQHTPPAETDLQSSTVARQTYPCRVCNGSARFSQPDMVCFSCRQSGEEAA